MISHHFDNPRFRVNFKMKFYFFSFEKWTGIGYIHVCLSTSQKRIEILMKKHNDKLDS